MKMITGILCGVILLLLWKIWTLHKNAKEIAEAFADRLNSDTNVLIDISGKDPHMKKLAASVNVQLRILREQRQCYQNGDRKLKEAVTNISHDLRTPLTAICGYLDLMEKEALSENAVRYLCIIRDRTETMKVMTEEMFQYMKVRSIPNQMSIEEICLNEILEMCLVDFYGIFTEKRILPAVFVPEKRVLAKGNKEALCRVFDNILSNVVKYSDGDLEVRLNEDGKIQFVNTASALNEVQTGQLFDRYFTVKTAQNTNGLGLSIAKYFMEQMAGTISAQYQESRLSITLTLPRSLSESYAYPQRYQ